MNLELAAALVALLIPIVMIDIRRRIIPNELVALGVLVALALLALTRPDALVAHILAAFGAGGFLLVAALARPTGMGMGDVKLAFMLGLFLGRFVAVAILAALVAGALYGLVLILRGGDRKATFAFGPFLAFGAVAGLLVGAE